MNSRRQKNFIQQLSRDQGWAVTHEDKAKVLIQYFDSILGHTLPRTTTFNWDTMQLPQLDLHALVGPLFEEEVPTAVLQLPVDKALGPDEFNGNFYHACWDIIKSDPMATLQSFFDMRTNNLPCSNMTNLVLLPKKEGAQAAVDFRTISLIHSFSKIFAKILTLRLSPFMIN